LTSTLKGSNQTALSSAGVVEELSSADSLLILHLPMANSNILHLLRFLMQYMAQYSRVLLS
jgi:hypothetical protein